MVRKGGGPIRYDSEKFYQSQILSSGKWRKKSDSGFDALLLRGVAVKGCGGRYWEGSRCLSS